MFETFKQQALSLRGSIVRAAVFAVAWAIFPFWLFLIAALYLFFAPPSQAKSVIMPFAVLLALAWFSPPGFFIALSFGLLFWCILLIKELYLVDRKSAYEVLMLALLFLLFGTFYRDVGADFAGAIPALGAVCTAVAAAALFRNFVGNFAPAGDGRSRLLRNVSGFVVFFVVFELLLAGLFLPLDFVYQTSVIFLLSAFFIDVAGRRLLSGGVARTQVLVLSSTVFGLLAIVLGSARWGL